MLGGVARCPVSSNPENTMRDVLAVSSDISWLMYRPSRMIPPGPGRIASSCASLRTDHLKGAGAVVVR
jgi:hypothetical protein